jgi:hypothetical protein
VRRKWQHQYADAISQIQTLSKTNHRRVSSEPASRCHSTLTRSSAKVAAHTIDLQLRTQEETFGSIQNRPIYTGGKPMGTIWYDEN